MVSYEAFVVGSPHASPQGGDRAEMTKDEAKTISNEFRAITTRTE